MLLAFEGLSFRYRNKSSYAIKEISMQTKEGSALGIMGREGAGKSTLCYSVNGIVPHIFKGEYSGRVLVFGKEVKKFPVWEMAKKVGMVFQDFESQLFSSNVELEVAFGLENLCLPRKEIKRRIEAYLDLVGLSALKKRDTSTLSGGQKQRLAIASVLAMEQPILVMDEPLTDLDPASKRTIMKVREKIKDDGRLLIIVENDPENMVDMDEIWIMREGQIVGSGKPKEILTNIQLLESSGIMVPEHIVFFRKIGLKEIPLTYEESIEALKKNFSFQKKIPPRIEKSDLGGDVIIEFKDVHFSYPDSQDEALRGINLVIREGEFVAIVGANGSGKTTLAKHANGLLKPKSGEVIVKKNNIKNYKRHEIARTVGYLFQNPDHQISSRTVLEEVSFALKLAGMGRDEINKRVDEALFATGLKGYEEKSPFLLSRGERQRVACASVLALKPQVLIFDEPTTGLDFDHQKKMMEMLKNLNEIGHTVLIITHSMWVVEKYAKRCVVMKDGKIVKDGPTRDVLRDEDTLISSSVYPSTITRIANFLKTQSIDPEGMIEELKNEGFSLSGKEYTNP